MIQFQIEDRRWLIVSTIDRRPEDRFLGWVHRNRELQAAIQTSDYVLIRNETEPNTFSLYKSRSGYPPFSEIVDAFREVFETARMLKLHKNDLGVVFAFDDSDMVKLELMR